MEQEASHGLIYSQSHEPLLVAMRRITPAEGDVAIGESEQPGVRDGDAMCVMHRDNAAHVSVREGLLGIDNPVVAEQNPQPGREGARISWSQKLAVKLKSPRWKALRSPATNLPRKTRLEMDSASAKWCSRSQIVPCCHEPAKRMYDGIVFEIKMLNPNPGIRALTTTQGSKNKNENRPIS